MTKATFWFNVFIPGNVPGYTRRIEKGPLRGKTAVPLPGLARPLNSEKPDDAGYLTDQRTFSSDIRASVRMQSWITVDLSYLTVDNWTGKAPGEHRTSGTIEAHLNSGEKIAEKAANMTSCRFKVVNKAPAKGYERCLALELEGSATDPLVRAAAEINYHGTLTFNAGNDGSLRVGFEGKVDQFPAYECYVSAGGKTQPLFQRLPAKGKTVVNLLNILSPQLSVHGSALFLRVVPGPYPVPTIPRLTRLPAFG